MSKRNVIIGPHHGGWQVKSSGAKRAASVHSTQAEAISSGRKIAINRQCELVIQGRNGQIRDSDSYGKDHCPPKDTKH